MATGKQNRDFKESIFDGVSWLDHAIEWIKNNMNINDVFSDQQIKSHVEDGDPGDFFSQSALQQWAEENGFVKEEE